MVGYQQVTGHWPDFSNSEDMQKVGAEAFAFVNFARLAVPLRIGLALGTTPWIDENIVQKFMKKEGEEEKVGERDVNMNTGSEKLVSRMSLSVFSV